MVDQLNWRMVRFTALHGGPAYTDLADVAAIMDTAEPHRDDELPVARGSTIYLKSGRAFYVRETPETVFEEVHRYHTMPEPVPVPKKLSAAAP